MRMLRRLSLVAGGELFFTMNLASLVVYPLYTQLSLLASRHAGRRKSGWDGEKPGAKRCSTQRAVRSRVAGIADQFERGGASSFSFLDVALRLLQGCWRFPFVSRPA